MSHAGSRADLHRRRHAHPTMAREAAPEGEVRRALGRQAERRRATRPQDRSAGVDALAEDPEVVGRAARVRHIQRDRASCQPGCGHGDREVGQAHVGSQIPVDIAKV